MTISKLQQLSKKYPNKWVALQEKTGKLISVGRTPTEVFVQSQKKGIKNPLVTKIPKEYGSYVLSQI